MANAAVRELFEQRSAGQCAARPCALVDGQARLVLQAADAALVASGTASLEALLCDCPMVVAYRLSAVTAFLVRSASPRAPAVFLACRTCWLARRLVPEFFQEQVNGENSRPRLGSSSMTARRRAMLDRALPRHPCEPPAAVERREAADAVLRLLRLGDEPLRCWLAGVDEAGRGPLAGPVVAAVVLLDRDAGRSPDCATRRS